MEFYFILAKGEYDTRGYNNKFALVIHEQSGTYTVYNQQDFEVDFEDIPYSQELNIPEVDLDRMLSGLFIRYFCDACGAGLGDDEFMYTPTGEGVYCYDCFDERYFTCSWCYEDESLEDAIETASGGKICPYCMEHYHSNCAECGEVYETAELENIEGRLICPECKEN